MFDHDEYFKGAEVTHALECSPAILRSGRLMCEVANKLLVLAKACGLPLMPGWDGSMVLRGWRPASINTAAADGRAEYLHVTGEAIDLSDPRGAIGRWCKAEAGTALRDLGLWLQDPADTTGSVHVQLKPPPTGERVFRRWTK